MKTKQKISSSKVQEKKDKAGVHHPQSNQENELTNTNSFTIVVSLRFLVSVVLCSALLAFCVGQFGAVWLLHTNSLTTTTTNTKAQITSRGDEQEEEDEAQPLYTVQHFDMSHSSVKSYSMALNNAASSSSEEGEQHAEEDEDKDDEDDDEGEEVSTPNCQHLLLDIEDVDALYLSSEDRLTESMLQLAEQTDLSPLQYTVCREQEEANGSAWIMCVAVLDGGSSRLAVTTWPQHGQIAVDLLVCAEERQDRDWAMNVGVPVLKDVFSVSVADQQQRPPHANWAYKRRGFRDESVQFNPADMDIEELVGSQSEEVQQLASVQSPFQRIDVYESIERKLTYGSSRHKARRPKNPEGVQYDRVVLLDHVEQSLFFGEAAYHEALVHPVMFSHPNPRRVAIIGGGEGATLREVLKHKTVESAVMIEIDETMVNVSRTHLPEWSDCSNIAGSAASCFDDPRTSVYFEDAIAWFIDRYLNIADFEKEDCFDVIIMDALDPTSVVEFSDMLYDNEDLSKAISNALGEEGVFVLQVGEGDSPNDPPEQYGNERRLVSFRQHLVDNGFQSVTEYDEMHCKFGEPWGYQIALKSKANLARFHSSEAEISLEIQKRTLATVNGESPFRFFDGATMMTYQQVPRLAEDTWCSASNTPCQDYRSHGLDPDVPSLPAHGFELKKPASDAEGQRLVVYAKQDIPRGSYIAPEETVQGLFLPPSTCTLLQNTSVTYNRPKLLLNFVERFGWTDDIYGKTAAGTNGGIFSFLNHGVDDAFNTSTLRTIERNKDPGTEAYNPFTMRHHANFRTWLNAVREIQAGGEVIDDLARHTTANNMERVW